MPKIRKHVVHRDKMPIHLTPHSLTSVQGTTTIQSVLNLYTVPKGIAPPRSLQRKDL